MLAAIEREQAFAIAWVRAGKGRNGAKGSIKRINARKGTRTSKRGTAASDTTMRNTKEFRQYNSIPIIDLMNGDLNTPKISHLIEYNGQRIRHWTGH